jgi:hypothetical protein
MPPIKLHALSTESVVVAAKNQVSSDLAGEAVILQVRSGRYFGLEQVGARIWQMIGEPRRVADIRDTILREYDVSRERCEQDVVTLLEQLAAEGLVEVVPRD